MNIALNNIVARTGQMKTDQTIFLRPDQTLARSSGLGRLAGLFSDARRAENRASVERLRQAVANSPEFKKFVNDGAIKHFFTQKLASATALTVREVRDLKANLDTLKRLDQPLQLGRALVKSGALPAGFASDFAVFTTSRKLPLTTETEQLKALRNFYEKKNFLAAPLSEACLKAGVPKDFLDQAVKLIMRTDEFQENLKQAFTGEIKNLNFNALQKAALATQAVTLMSTLAGGQNALETLPKGEVSTIFNSLVEMTRAGHIKAGDEKNFLAFCAGRGLILGQPLERHQALGLWHLEPQAVGWGEAAARDLNLPPEVGRTLAHLPEVKEQILAQLLAPPTAPPNPDLVKKAAQEVMTGFLKEKGETINKFLSLAQPPHNGLNEKLNVDLTEARLQTLLSPFLAVDALLDKLLAPSEKQTGLSLDLAETVRALTRTMEASQENKNEKILNVYRRNEDLVEAIFLTTHLLDDALLLQMRHRDLSADKLAGAIREYLKPLCQNFSALEKDLQDGRIGGLRAQPLKEDLEGMREVLLKLGELASKLAGGGDLDENELDEWEAGGVTSLHQSVRDLANSYGLNMRNIGYQESSELVKNEMTAWFGPDNAPAPVVTELFRQELRRLSEEIGLTEHFAVNPEGLPLGALASLAAKSTSQLNQVRLSPEQAREAVRQVLREELKGLKGAFDYIEGLPGKKEEGSYDKLQGGGLTLSEKHVLRQVVMANNITNPVLIKATIEASREMTDALMGLAPELTRETMAETILKMSSRSFSILDAAQVDKKGELEKPRVLPAALMLALVSPAMEEKNTPVGQSPLAQKAKAFYAALTSSAGKSLGGDFLTLSEETKQRPETFHRTAVLINALQIMNLTRQILGQGLGHSYEDDPDFESPLYYSHQVTPLNRIPGPVCAKALEDLTQFLPGLTALSRISPPLSAAQYNSLRLIMEMLAPSLDQFPFAQELLLNFVSAHAQEMLAAMKEKGGDDLTAAELWGVIFGKTEKAPADLSVGNLGQKIYNAVIGRIYALAAKASPDAHPAQLEFMCGQCLNLGLPLAKLEGMFRPGGRLSLEDFRNRHISLTLSSLRDYDETNDFGLSVDFHRRASQGGTTNWLAVNVTEEGRTEEVETRFQKGPFAAITLAGTDGRETKVTNEGLTIDNCQGHPKHRTIIEACRGICGSELQFRRVMQCFSQASTILIRMNTECFPHCGVGEHSHCDMTARQQENGEVLVTVENSPQAQPAHYRMQFIVDSKGEARMTDLEIVRSSSRPNA